MSIDRAAWTSGVRAAFPFSNFEPLDAPINGYDADDPNPYWTVEAAYQAAKTTDPSARRAIAQAPNARAAKRLGRLVALRDDWLTQVPAGGNLDTTEPFSVVVMRTLLQRKFEQPTFLLRLVRWHGPIVEWNRWHDRFWGKCTCKRHQDQGANRLGVLLTEIRTQILQHAHDVTGVVAADGRRELAG